MSRHQIVPKVAKAVSSSTQAPIPGFARVILKQRISTVPATNDSDVYRAAKLALLRMQAHNMMEQTDASAREVQEVLERFAEGRLDASSFDH